MIKRFIIAIVLLVIVGGGIVGFNLFRDQAIEQFFANMPVPAVTVSTVEVVPITWTPGIETIGTVSAARGVDLTVETTGIVEELLFDANQRVEAGDVLVQLDDQVESADLDAARTKATIEAEALDRATRLRERGVGTDVTVDVARAAASTSASQVAKLEALVDQKQVRAPFAGTMGIPKVDKGQYLAPGTIVATLQDLDTMRVDFSIPEQELGSLKIGQPVALGLGGGDLPYQGTITGIDPKVDPQSRLVAVRAEIDNPGGELTPGQFVQVRVELPTEDGVIAVPQTALVSSLYGDFVFVVRPAKPPETPTGGDGEAPSGAMAAEAPAQAAGEAAPPAADQPLTTYQVFVTPGRRNGGLVEISKGLSAGDQIVTAGQNRLTNGTPVKVDNTVNPLPTLNEAAGAQ